MIRNRFVCHHHSLDIVWSQSNNIRLSYIGWQFYLLFACSSSRFANVIKSRLKYYRWFLMERGLLRNAWNFNDAIKVNIYSFYDIFSSRFFFLLHSLHRAVTFTSLQLVRQNTTSVHSLSLIWHPFTPYIPYAPGSALLLHTDWLLLASPPISLWLLLSVRSLYILLNPRQIEFDQNMIQC